MRRQRTKLTPTRYILLVLELVGKHVRFFFAAALAAVALRLIFLVHFPGIVDDSRLYADIAMNWLQYGVYGISNSGQVVPTLSRLPGYPAFLAVVFAVFGWSNFRAVLLVQIVFDLGTCLLVADLARRMFSDQAAKAAFMVTALCPFLANYAAAVLTETLEIFFTALALDCAIWGLAGLRPDGGSPPWSKWLPWLGCGLAVGACLLLRPDGGILLAALGAYLFLLLVSAILQQRRSADNAPVLFPIVRAAIILVLGALAPLVPWTLRNLHTLHRFQPLAPRYANDSDEPVMVGFNRWTKTWIADYTSVQEIYWNVPGSPIDISRLPRRAFDSAQQRQETAEVFADYNQEHDITPELDQRFAALAAARIRAAPLRYYIWLPALRIADMWLRARTELLPSDPRWWEFNDDRTWLAVSIVFGLLNLAYVVAALAGFLRGREIYGFGLFVLFLILRSLFLGTLENPEPRYTLECYPVLIMAASALFIGKTHRTHRKPA
ncbi:MAG TPA: glycosyltransferase family 39 protein [Candidatus Polarisedimenticolia bacterium]|nr:glycosyltransferase family 39 protein [Candidatus Polarisedimenticolia bacterium]